MASKVFALLFWHLAWCNMHVVTGCVAVLLYFIHDKYQENCMDKGAWRSHFTFGVTHSIVCRIQCAPQVDYELFSWSCTHNWSDLQWSDWQPMGNARYGHFGGADSCERHLLIIIGYFIWVNAIPQHNQTAASIGNAIIKLCSNFGIPTDHCRNCEGCLFFKCCKLLVSKSHKPWSTTPKEMIGGESCHWIYWIHYQQCSRLPPDWFQPQGQAFFNRGQLYITYLNYCIYLSVPTSCNYKDCKVCL